MADSTIAARQYIPLTRNNPINEAPSSYANTPTAGFSDEYKGQSFHDVLNRTQLTSAQLRSMQAPQNNRTSMLSTIPPSKQSNHQTTSQTAQDTVSFIPDPSLPYNPQTIQEIREHLKSAPTEVSDDAYQQALQSMQQNMQEYKQQEATESGTGGGLSSALQQNAVQSTPEPQTGDVETSSALHAILARNAINTPTVEEAPSMGVVKRPPIEPAVRPSNNFSYQQTNQALNPPTIQSAPVNSEPIVNPASYAGFPAYIPASQMNQQMDAQNQALALSKIQNEETASEEEIVLKQHDVLEENETQDTEAGDKKNSGFFQAIGSFFGNIASAVTLGFYRPGGEAAPEGFARVVDPFKKVVWDAPKSIIVDAPVGAYHDIADGKDSGDSETAESNSLLQGKALAMNVDERPYRGVKTFGRTSRMMGRNYHS